MEVESDDSTPKAKAKDTKGKKPLAASIVNEDSDESDDKPVVVAKGKAPVVAAKGKVVAKPKSDSEESEEDHKPVVKGKAPVVVAKVAKKVVVESDSDESDKPVVKAKVAPVVAKAAKKQVVEEDSDDKEEVKAEAPKNEVQGSFEVFVKKLSYKAVEADLKSFFAKCGPVTNVKLLKEPDGRSKGMGFVEFPTESA